MYKGQWLLSPLHSRHLGISHSSPNHHQLPHCISLTLINGLKTLPFQRWFLVLRKARSPRDPNLSSQGAESPGRAGFTRKLCTSGDAWAGTLSWWSCPSPVAHGCGLLNHPNSFSGGMSHLNAKFDADLWIYSVTLNVTATQDTCSLNGVYRPHGLVQWSHHCSCMFIPVHSSWLPGYIDVMQTIPVILTMVGLFMYLLELMGYSLFLSILIRKRKINVFLMVKLWGWNVPIGPGLPLLMFYLFWTLIKWLMAPVLIIIPYSPCNCGIAMGCPCRSEMPSPVSRRSSHSLCKWRNGCPGEVGQWRSAMRKECQTVKVISETARPRATPGTIVNS